jgi:Lrp/AsnC family transcriptional regulator, leucine-responsive regulatory protein
MDDIDRRLLQLLREDASRPLKALAAEVQLSRSAVRERISRLETGGVIRRYTVELAPSEGALTAILMVKLQRTPSPKIVAFLAAMPEVARCLSLSGEVDLLVELRGGDVAAINQARDAIATQPGVANVVTSFVLKRDKEPA